MGFDWSVSLKLKYCVPIKIAEGVSFWYMLKRLAEYEPGYAKRAHDAMVTGDPLAEVMESHGDFAECFERLLSDRDGGDDERWDAYRVFEGERCPRNLGEYDGVVVTGSKFDAQQIPHVPEKHESMVR